MALKYLYAFAILLALFCSTSSWAVRPDEMLANPAQEARARALSKELRCMVCQNESIDDSEAPLAHDLRVLVRERIKDGDSDAQVIDFLVARYGEFVLLKPRLSWHTAALWALPPGMLLIGVLTTLVMARRRKYLPAASLTAAEEARVTQLLRSEESP
jgi:cytochrome c-type biogenesis protein CcmH